MYPGRVSCAQAAAADEGNRICLCASGRRKCLCRSFVIACSALLSLLLFTGCGRPARIPSPAEGFSRLHDFLTSDTRVIVTTRLDDEELFRIEDVTCSLTEYLVCLINMQKTYEKGFSPAIWDGEEGAALAESVKSNALAQIGRIKTMSLLAADQGIELTEAERTNAASVAEAYDTSLSEADRAAMGDPDLACLTGLTEGYLLSDKVYHYYISDIDPEVSDDEARRVTVQQIVLRTWEYDSTGTRIPMDADTKQALLQRARQIRSDYESGADFTELAATYNEADETELSFGRGETDPVVESIAFSLARDEVSDVFETDDGITLLYMVNTFDRAETEANKIRIMDERRHEAFDKEYDRFASEQARTFNEEVYEKASLTSDPEVTTSDFFLLCENACE